MKKALLMLFLGLALVSCEDREPEPILIPEWLKPRLTELESSGECYGCQVQRWSYNEEYFYHLYCGYWSCSDCEVYHYDGRRVEWGATADPVDFNENKHRPVLVWECGDEL
ncbi:hypothetical protein [Draconibacterium halophilum]|uniref:Uncharacterized protein n=1 Tax=Draconibacterium halophilum TaxID=2706887 RepID=A0A6C0RKH9_9BACT|nr:hypothetical protein [Draconibacterium halophilum]QIA09781.1 hypothetical protein G0Q07_19650 [Draconibacterium halophilum]